MHCVQVGQGDQLGSWDSEFGMGLLDTLSSPGKGRHEHNDAAYLVSISKSRARKTLQRDPVRILGIDPKGPTRSQL